MRIGKSITAVDTHVCGEPGRVIAGSEYPAVIPTISGQAWITGTAKYTIDPDDPFPEGFTVADIWGQAS